MEELNRREADEEEEGEKRGVAEERRRVVAGVVGCAAARARDGKARANDAMLRFATEWQGCSKSEKSK